MNTALNKRLSPNKQTNVQPTTMVSDLFTGQRAVDVCVGVVEAEGDTLWRQPIRQRHFIN